MWFLSHLQAITNSFLNDTCTIEQEIESKSQLGVSRKWELVANNIPCRLITVGNRFTNSVTVQDGQEVLEDTYRLVFPIGTAIAPDQRITTSSGRVYKVVSIMDEKTDKTDLQVIIKILR